MEHVWVDVSDGKYWLISTWLGGTQVAEGMARRLERS